jgi:hypothetical protein
MARDMTFSHVLKHKVNEIDTDQFLNEISRGVASKGLTPLRHLFGRETWKDDVQSTGKDWSGSGSVLFQRMITTFEWSD